MNFFTFNMYKSKKVLLIQLLYFLRQSSQISIIYMRISTSPSPMNSRVIQTVYPIQQNIRSSSLSNTSLFSSKVPHQYQNSYISPYYNSNSGIRIISQQQVHPLIKNQGNENRNTQNLGLMQSNIKKLMERVQIIQKKLKKQSANEFRSKKTQEQKLFYHSLQQKIQKELQRKTVQYNEKIYNEIKKMQEELKEKFKLFEINQNKQENNHHQSNVFQQRNYKNNQFQIQSNKQKANIKLIEEKIKQQTFKIQIHLENEINKNISLLKLKSQNTNVSIVSRSKLKYKYTPIQISIKNQVSVGGSDNNLKYDNYQKKKKQALSTAHSSGSSEQQENKSTKKLIQIDQQKYYIDKQGYLLDVNGFYLLNENQKMIRIDKNLIKKLKQCKVMV